MFHRGTGLFGVFFGFYFNFFFNSSPKSCRLSFLAIWENQIVAEVALHR